MVRQRADYIVREGEYPFPLTDLPEGPLHLIFDKLEAKDLLRSVPKVSRASAAAVEAVCAQRARKSKLRLAARPRGKSNASCYPYLNLLRSRACVACANPGEFHLRLTHRSNNNATIGLLCCKCSKDSSVVDALIQKGVYVDLIGISGKKLNTEVRRGKRRPNRRGASAAAAASM